MDRDFHFFATQAASIAAGFNDKQALTIASSAQYIDNCTEKVTHNWTFTDCELRTVNVDNGTKFTPIITAVYNMLSWAGTSNSNETRQIWMPFHFVPGNYPDQNSPAIVRSGKAEKSLELLTRPRSDSARDMVNFTVKMYKELVLLQTDQEKDTLAQMLTGICMHVFADTYAHQDFSGVKSTSLNGTKNRSNWNKGRFTNKGKWDGIKWMLDNKSLKDISWAWGCEIILSDPLTTYSTIPTDKTSIGHGQVGHLPDVSSIAFEYTPQWMSSAEQHLIRNNPEQYLCCYIEMVHALECIREGKEFYWYSEKELNDVYQKNQSAYDKVKQLICPDEHKSVDIKLYEDGLNIGSKYWFQSSEERWQIYIKEQLKSPYTIRHYLLNKKNWDSEGKKEAGRKMSLADFTSSPYFKWNCAAKIFFKHQFIKMQKNYNTRILTSDCLSESMPVQENLVDDIAEFFVPALGSGEHYSLQNLKKIKVTNEQLRHVKSATDIEKIFFGKEVVNTPGGCKD